MSPCRALPCAPFVALRLRSSSLKGGSRSGVFPSDPELAASNVELLGSLDSVCAPLNLGPGR